MPKRPIVILEVVQWLVVEWNCDAAIVKLDDVDDIVDADEVEGV